jgi:hypothetical protein
MDLAQIERKEEDWSWGIRCKFEQDHRVRVTNGSFKNRHGASFRDHLAKLGEITTAG